MRLRRWLLPLLWVLLAACSGTQQSPSLAPTLELIHATETDTPTPAPPTATLEPRTQPQDLFTTPTAPALPESTSESWIDVDPIAAELVGIAQRVVAQDLDLSTRRVRLVEIAPYVWTDSSLGCPAPGQSYTPIESRGYRILVSAGEEDYLFHTDFDRLLPCDPDNERLPVEATPEATAESTPELTEEITLEATEDDE